VIPPLRRSILALLLLQPAAAHADVLIDNVDGLTLNASGAAERFSGLLVGDDGRIEQVLQRGDKRPGKVDYKLDGKGRVLIPGLIDSHVELMKFGLSLLTGDDAPPESKPRPEDRDLALAKAQQALLARGVTTVADMGTTIEDWQAYRRAGDLGTLRLRVVGYAEGVDAMILIGGPSPTTWLYDDRLRLNGVHLTLDGLLASRAAALKTPYAGGPAKGAAPRLSDTQLKNLMSRAAMDMFQVAVDASGDKASGDALDAIDELVLTYKGERRWRIERAEAIDPADLPRFGKNGVIASVQPPQLAGLSAVETALGPARTAGAYAWKPLADAGATLAFGSGTPAAASDPFAGMAAAITRPAQPLTREAALAAYTTGGAQALFAEGRIGRIAKGARADFVLIDADPLLAAPDQLKAIRVVETWVGGKRVYQAASPAPDQSEGR
jgi:predicted amidohydrolase YtcJ